MTKPILTTANTKKIHDKHPFIGWKLISAFRNVLVHDYSHGYDFDEIWKIIIEKLSELQNAMLKEIPD